MNPPRHKLHVQTVPTPSSTKLLASNKNLDSDSQPKNHKKGENIEANVVFHLLTSNGLDATGPLNTVKQAEGLAALGINGSSL